MPSRRSVLSIAVAFCLSCTGATQAQRASDGVATLKAGERAGRFALQAQDASLAQVAALFERKFGCIVEIEPSLRDQRVTLNLSARPVGQIFPALARRIEARLDFVFRVRPLEPNQKPPPGSSLFAERAVQVRHDGALELTQAFQQLRLPVEMAAGVGGKVRPPNRALPLHLLLDSLAKQVSARWETVIRLSRTSSAEGDPAEYDRMHTHYTMLAYLTSEERQEEISAQLDRLTQLPDAARQAGILRMREDILSLGGMMRSVPGEHRERFGGGILAIARDYQVVLGRQKGGRFASLSRALDELQRALNQIH